MTAGTVRVVHGRIWATLDGPHGGTPDTAGDHILQVGQSLHVSTGQRVVLEAWNDSGPSYFTWEPLRGDTGCARGRPNAAAVLQSLADLRLAASMALRATGQLAAGVLRLGCQLFVSPESGRPRPRRFTRC